MAARESRTSRSAYSVRSWPSCSFHKRTRKFLILPPFFIGCIAIWYLGRKQPLSVGLSGCYASILDFKFSARRAQLRGQVASRLVEDRVDRIGQRAQCRDCCQRKQNKQ